MDGTRLICRLITLSFCYHVDWDNATWNVHQVWGLYIKHVIELRSRYPISCSLFHMSSLVVNMRSQISTTKKATYFMHSPHWMEMVIIYYWHNRSDMMLLSISFAFFTTCSKRGQIPILSMRRYPITTHQIITLY